MPSFHVIVSRVLVFAVVAAGLQVPVFYHGETNVDGAGTHVHAVVHRHHGRLHVHIHHHEPHGCGHHSHHGQHGDSEHHNETEHDHGHCEADHAPEIWLSAGAGKDTGDMLAGLRLAENSPYAALVSMRMTAGEAGHHGRAPPEPVCVAGHLGRLRPVILRL